MKRISDRLSRSALRLVLGFGAALALSSSAVGCGDTTPPPATPATPPVNASATVPPPDPPLTTDPPPVTDGDTTSAYFHGMQIVVKRTPGAEFVAAQLTIRGGVRDWTKDNAGIEDLAVQVATSGGTQSLAKRAYSMKLASLGAQIGADAGNDSSKFSTKAPTASWDALFPIFADTFLAPALPDTEFEIVKQRELSSRRHEMETGDGRLWLLARPTVFANHPYANRAVGTVETLSSVKAADIAPHMAKLRDTNRLIFVVVGDVDPRHVLDQVKTAFANVPRGSYVDTPIPPLHYASAHVVGDAFKLPTNYIQSTFAGPAWKDPDFATMRLTMSLLGQRVFDEVRTKRNLSYAPNAYFNYGLNATFGVMYVTTVDPNATMKVMFDETRRLQTEVIPAKELEGTKAVYISSLTASHETVDGLAYELSDAILLGGDYHLANTFAERVKKVSADDIRRVSTTWLSNMQTAIVGDPTKLDPKIVGVTQ